ncbi:hypothetical protein [Promicromonospora sp. NPDC050880]|uniref:hypothetical protein n=1 Tax=Promicromonospora sp. NPDC050880 TaxID=3364406 RepID=UPI0037A60BB9
MLQGTLPRDGGSVAVRGLTLPPGVAMAPPLMSLTPQAPHVFSGQLHRLAAARMLAHPADVLLIDDLSASLDVETERLLLDNLLSRSRGSVLVVVSNRASVLDRADQVHRLVPGS